MGFVSLFTSSPSSLQEYEIVEKYRGFGRTFFINTRIYICERQDDIAAEEIMTACIFTCFWHFRKMLGIWQCIEISTLQFFGIKDIFWPLLSKKGGDFLLSPEIYDQWVPTLKEEDIVTYLGTFGQECARIVFFFIFKIKFNLINIGFRGTV